jgi:metallo-beta-lactamase family protein
MPEVKARFQYNGHIIGSTFIELDIHHKRFVFSGDVGRLNDLLLFKPLRPKKADFLFLESTYGARFHPEEKDTIPAISSIINETVVRGGSLFIPSFSVGRSQLLMYILWQLVKEKKIPEIPMIIDSPMGLSVLELLYRSRDWHKLDENEFIEMCRNFKIVDNFKDTLDWREDERSKIVIAGSGMMTGGRILNYLETNSADPRNTLLFVGYQAEETRGRKILEGAREVKVYGKTLPFRMQVEEIEGLSAHADQRELLNWVKDIKNQPENVFLIHGEMESSVALQTALLEKYQWESEIPDLFSIKSIVL